MIRMPKWCRRILCQLRQNYDTLAMATILWLMAVGIMHYLYVRFECDLLCWNRNVGPSLFMLYMVMVKVFVILFTTLWSYLKVGDKEQEQTDMPISAVKRRYRRFIMMRLLKAVDKLVHCPLRDALGYGRVKKRFLKRRSRFIKEVELFLWNGRKLYERTDEQLCLPLCQVLLVDDRREEQLLQLGYGDRLTSLKDVDIHKMVYG